MKITYHPMFTDKFKFNFYALNFMMPLTEHNASCAALLAQILKRGCKKYGEMDRINAALEKLYGASVNISSDKIGTNLSFTLQIYYMDDRYALDGEQIRDAVFDIASEMLFSTQMDGEQFRADYFEQECQNQIDMINSSINDKRTFSMKRCREIMFADSVYRFSGDGSVNCLKSLTIDKLLDFYRMILSDASVMVTYIGTKMNVEGITEKFFAPIFGGGCLALNQEQVVATVQCKIVDEAYDVAQGKLCLGYRFCAPVNYYAAKLLNVVFGASPTSKLFNNVRERLSLCYYCSSGFDPFVHSIFVTSGIEFKNYEIAKAEIEHQLEEIQKGNISEEEFENSKAYLIDSLLGIGDSQSALWSDVVRNQLLGVEDDIDAQVCKFRHLRRQDIIVAAKSLRLDTVYFLKGKESR